MLAICSSHFIAGEYIGVRRAETAFEGAHSALATRILAQVTLD